MAFSVYAELGLGLAIPRLTNSLTALDLCVCVCAGCSYMKLKALGYRKVFS